MVENRPWANFFAHTVLIIGVALVVFPVYIAVVASTQAPGELMRGTMPLLPGSHGIENYTQMWQSGISFSDVLLLADLCDSDVAGGSAYYPHLSGGRGP